LSTRDGGKGAEIRKVKRGPLKNVKKEVGKERMTGKRMEVGRKG
jgi:hypothetical protein